MISVVMQHWPESASVRSINWPKNPSHRPRGHWAILIVKPSITCTENITNSASISWEKTDISK